MISDADLTKLIKDFQEGELPSPIYPRELEVPISMPIRRAISIVGPRRVGKSYEELILIKRLLDGGIDKTRILFVSFDNPIFIGAAAKDAKRIIDVYFQTYPQNIGKKVWLFLDEIQVIKEWEVFVRSLVDNKEFSVYLTGSSAKLLSREIATHLRGRNLSYELYPLDFSEFLSFSGTTWTEHMSTRQESNVVSLFGEYFEWGGYPETVLYKRERERILKEILDVTIQRDIIERYGIRNTKILRLLIVALAGSSEFSINRFFHFLKSSGHKVSKNTLYTYFQALLDAYVVHEIRRYARSYKSREQLPVKVYFTDNGLLRVNNIAEKSKLMENLVCNQLVRKYGSENVCYYSSNYEVDFLVVKAGRPAMLLQVSYDLSDMNTRERGAKGTKGAPLRRQDAKCLR